MKQLRYNVIFNHLDINGDITTGYNSGLKMNSTPMTHSEACIFRIKMMSTKRTIYTLKEA